MRIRPLLLLPTLHLAFSFAAYGADAVPTSSVEDQTGVAVTVYNNNLALIKDQRQVRLPEGVTPLRFTGVASGIIPASVSIRSTTDASSLKVLEQNYEYDLISPERLMEKYIGKEVTLYHLPPLTKEGGTVKATLLSKGNGGTVYRVGSDISFGHAERVILPGVPDNLYSSPTLVWLLENNNQKLRNIETSYLTNGINWRADYVLNLSNSDDVADLNGWVTLDNKSGATYRNATLKLVAGDVNRSHDGDRYPGERMVSMKAAAASPFREESFFEYHIYTLDRRSTIGENQVKQISLLSREKIPVKRDLVLRNYGYYYRGRSGDEGMTQKVSVYLEIENRHEKGLGMPLPKGLVRVYQRDSDGSLQFVGEDSIDHTAKDEKIRVKVGEAFDVVASRKMTEYRTVSEDIKEMSYEIVLRNHKKEDVTVTVIEPHSDNWTMLSSSHQWKKVDADTIELLVRIKKNGEQKITYKVRSKL